MKGKHRNTKERKKEMGDCNSSSCCVMLCYRCCCCCIAVMLLSCHVITPQATLLLSEIAVQWKYEASRHLHRYRHHHHSLAVSIYYKVHQDLIYPPLASPSYKRKSPQPQTVMLMCGVSLQQCCRFFSHCKQICHQEEWRPQEPVKRGAEGQHLVLHKTWLWQCLWRTILL